MKTPVIDPRKSSFISQAIQQFEANWSRFLEESFQKFPLNAQEKRTKAFKSFIQLTQNSSADDAEVIKKLTELSMFAQIGLRSKFKRSRIDESESDFNEQILNYKKPIMSGDGLLIKDCLFIEKDVKTFLDRNDDIRMDRRSNLIEGFSSAFANSDTVIRISKNRKIKEPISFSLKTTKGEASISLVTIICEEESDATIILDISGSVDTKLNGSALSLRIQMEPRAKLKMITIENFPLNSFFLSTQSVYMDDDSSADWTSIHIGGQYTLDNFSAWHQGEGCTSKQNGVFICGNGQDYNNISQQIHLAKRTNSRFLLRGIQIGDGTSNWKGNIFVSRGAERTDSYQANRNLILSPNAKAVSIPGLEILSDDVKCSHGATISNIDQNELFYLQSRGISKSEAIQLLALGYLQDVMKNLPDSHLIDEITKKIKNDLLKELTNLELSDARIN